MKVIIKKPGEQYGYTCDIENTLENLHNIVGGYIETVPCINGALIICNEEGKLKDLKINMPYYDDTLCGTIIVCGVSGEDFGDVPITFDEWKKYVDSQMELLNK